MSILMLCLLWVPGSVRVDDSRSGGWLPSPSKAYETVLTWCEQNQALIRESIAMERAFRRGLTDPAMIRDVDRRISEYYVMRHEAETMRRDLIRKYGTSERVAALEASLPPVAPMPRAGKPRDARPYVEVDFSTPATSGDGTAAWSITILTSDKDLSYKGDVKWPRRVGREDACVTIAIRMQDHGFDTEVVDKFKLRVYGRITTDRLIPATRGIVESKDLKPEELPKVKNPTKEN